MLLIGLHYKFENLFIYALELFTYDMLFKKIIYNVFFLNTLLDDFVSFAYESVRKYIESTRPKIIR